jgi:hypothetical protein
MTMQTTRWSLSTACRYYRDRLSVPRGPCNISVLRECWVHGVIDDGTLVWGQGLIDWLPVKNVRTLVPQIRTLEGVRMLLHIINTLIRIKEPGNCPLLHSHIYLLVQPAAEHTLSQLIMCSTAFLVRGRHASLCQ